MSGFPILSIVVFTPLIGALIVAVAPSRYARSLALAASLVAWVVSLFAPSVAVYAVPNDGGWYDFGYFLGIVVFGVGARKTHVVTRDNVINARARRVE